MPWTPQFSEAGESEFIDKMMVVVHRDMKPALDYFYAAAALPDFAAMVRGDSNVFLFPLLVVGLERMTSQETENGEWLSQELTAGAGLVVKDVSVAAVEIRAEKYVRAFKAVVRKGVLEMLPGPSSLVEYTIDINHQYFKHATKGTDFVKPVQFEIRIRFGEK